MRINKLFKTAVIVAACTSMTLPLPAMARLASAQAVDGVNIAQDIKNVRLGVNGSLRGTIVDENGKPVAGAPVMIGQQGKIVAQTQTAADGRYGAELSSGVYQVASYAGVQNVRVYQNNAPADSVDGVVQVIDQGGIARGKHGHHGHGPFAGLKYVLTNPVTWALIIAAAIAIPLALDDDDDAS